MCGRLGHLDSLSPRGLMVSLCSANVTLHSGPSFELNDVFPRDAHLGLRIGDLEMRIARHHVCRVAAFVCYQTEKGSRCTAARDGVL